jgi:hypothetical protein
LNPGKEVTSIDHVAEVNENIVNLDSSENMNLWALNQSMDFDVRIKEKLPVEEKRVVNHKLVDPQHFITLPDANRDIVLEKNIIRSFNHIPEVEGSNILDEQEPEIDHDPKEKALIVNVDDSYSSEVSDGDAGSETVENNSIFYNDGEENVPSEYVKNMCIPGSSEPEVMARVI